MEKLHFQTKLDRRLNKIKQVPGCDAKTAKL
jgi:hypothetical protein